MTPTLLSAILAMDAYNRGGADGHQLLSLPDTNGNVGTAAVLRASNPQLDTDINFVAVAYTLANGQTVISYRCTDQL